MDEDGENYPDDKSPPKRSARLRKHNANHQTSTQRQPTSRGSVLTEKVVPNTYFQSLEVVGSVAMMEDVYDIPDTSPEKTQKPLPRPDDATEPLSRPRLQHNSKKQTQKQPQRKRGRPLKAASQEQVLAEPMSVSEEFAPEQAKSLQSDDNVATPMGEVVPNKGLNRRQETFTSLRQNEHRDTLTLKSPKRSALEPPAKLSPRRSRRLLEKPAKSSTIKIVVPKPSQVFDIDLSPKSLDGPIRENGAQESSPSDVAFDEESDSGTSDSASQNDDVSSFECFGLYDDWLTIKDAASSSNATENGDDRVKRKIQAHTTHGKEFLVLARNISGSYDKFKEFSHGESHPIPLQPTFDDVETAIEELKVYIESIDAESIKSDAVNFLHDVYQAIVPFLVHVLDKAMNTLSSIYTESRQDERDITSLRMIIDIQSLTLDLCQFAKAWKATYAKQRKIRDVATTTRQILPFLRDQLKPAFEREFVQRKREYQQRQHEIRVQRNIERDKAERRAKDEQIAMRQAELLRLQKQQLLRNRSLYI